MKFKGLPNRKKHPSYSPWLMMRARCNTPGATGFAHYGGRGVQVCSRWDSFELFVEDMGPRPSPQHTIERADEHGDYEPGNCRWATRLEQSRNRPSYNRLDLDKVRELRCRNKAGEGYRKLARELGVPVSTIRMAIVGNTWKEPTQ